jgi:hypothetical protein
MNTATLPTDWSQVANSPGLDESRYADDAKLFVQFYRKPVIQPVASQEAGRAVYKETEHR